MKIMKFLCAGVILTTIMSCGTDDNGIDPATDVTNGAIVERVATVSNTFFTDNLEGSLNTLLEYRDAEGGSLLDEMQVFVTFFDNSEGQGDSTNATVGIEVPVTTIQASAFTNGENDFPTYNLIISSQDFLTATNNTLEGIATDDRFITRLALVLTDGRIFSNLNIGNNGGVNTDFVVVTEVE